MLTVYQVITGGFAGIALIVSGCALVVARKSMRIAAAKDAREVADRRDAAGPTFEAEPATVHERAADLRIRVVGGPGAMAVDIRSAGVAWCRGLSAGAAGEVAESVWFPPRESGDVIFVTAHLTVDPWEGHSDGVALPLLLDVQSREEPPRRWERRVSVQLMPPPPRPMVY